jgi:hypothetical protein
MPESGIATLHTPIQQHNRESFNNLIDNELTVLTTLVLHALLNRGVSMAGLLPAPPRPSDMWENAKVEQTICSGLRLLYDGSPENLIHLLYIRRKNEVWMPATFILQVSVQVDLVLQFSKVTHDTVL